VASFARMEMGLRDPLVGSVAEKFTRGKRLGFATFKMIFSGGNGWEKDFFRIKMKVDVQTKVREKIGRTPLELLEATLR